MSYVRFVAGVAVCLMATPVLAQSNPNAAKPNEQTAAQQQQGNTTFDSSTGAQKQHTQGLPAGTVPPQYGADWSRRQAATKSQ
jgi:hypothetical protein